MALTTTEHDFGTPAEVKGNISILDAVREWRSTGENLLESLGVWVSDIEAREKSLRLATESLEEGLKDLAEREREIEVRKAELASKDGELGPLLEEFAKENELREEQLDDQLKLVNKHIQNLEDAQNEVQGLKLLEYEKLKEIEKREREVDLAQQSLENRLSEIEQREKEFESFTDRKLGELLLKEEELVNKVELADEKFKEKENLCKGLIHGLDSALDKLEGMKLTIDKRFEETNLWETASHKTLTVFADEADLIREQLEKRIEEFEKLEIGFNAYLADNMQLSELKNHQHPSVIREELLKEVKLVDEKLSGQQELGHQLLERLEDLMAKKLNGVDSLQLTLNVTSETFDAKDSDLVRESKDVQLQELEKRKEEFRLYLEEKERELELKGKMLDLIVEELIQEIKRFDEQEKPMHALLVRLELVQSNLKSMNSKKQSEFDNGKDCTEKKLNDLECKAEKTGNHQKRIKENRSDNHTLLGKDQQPKLEVKKLELNGESSDVPLKESELKRLTDLRRTHLCVEPMGFAGFPQTVELTRLQAIMRKTKKDFKLMAGEVSEVLIESPDPAKLVLDAMQWFHTFYAVNGDTELNMRRTCMLLLDQITKMSAKIHPSVREAAVDLANEWKSEIETGDENTVQVLEFLNLLVAYDISSSFSKGELVRLLQIVAQLEKAPELCCLLGLTDNMQGFVQNLINEKQYLLASTYIHECKLENMFPQTAVLNFYVKQVKMTANVKFWREHLPDEAKVKIISDEIDDLHVVIQHIAKLGLEYEYSPDILMGRIRQLESEQAKLRNGMPMPLLDDPHKREMDKTFPRLHDASRRMVQQTDEAEFEAMLVTRAHVQHLEGRTTPPAWQRQSKTKTHHGRKTVVDEWGMRHGNSSRKRHRTTTTRDFGHRRLPPNHDRRWC